MNELEELFRKILGEHVEEIIKTLTDTCLKELCQVCLDEIRKKHPMVQLQEDELFKLLKDRLQDKD